MMFCQSCSMPIEQDEQRGSEKDGALSSEYCIYCYKGGEFTQELTMEQMIDHCSQFYEEFDKDSDKKYTKEEVIEQMREYLPKLKRWSRQER